MRTTRLHHRLMLSAAAVALLGGTAARAADLSTYPPPPAPAPVEQGCHHQGMIGGSVGGTHFSPDRFLGPGNGFVDAKTYDYQAEAAWLGTCGHWNLQADAGLTGYGSFDEHPKQLSADGLTWRVGGILFARDPMRGLIGFDAAYMGQSADFVVPFQSGPTDKTFKGFRVGARGEFFASANLTVGGRVGYLDLGDFHGFEGDIFARYYANENLALTARLDGALLDGFDADSINGIGVTAIGEYLVSGSHLSLFGEASYYHWDYDLPGPPIQFKVSGIRAMVGAKVYFNSRESTLAGIHRNGPLDNSSFWMEDAHGPLAAAPTIIFPEP